MTQNTTETPTEELLSVCFVPTMKDEWYEDQYCVSSNGTERWLVDTGATTHITMTDEYMTNVENVKVSVIVGYGKEVVCTKRGDILITNKNVFHVSTQGTLHSSLPQEYRQYRAICQERRVRGTHEGV